MYDSLKHFKRRLAIKWVRAKSGTTYLCPLDEISKIKNPTEEDYKRLCVNESENPQGVSGG